MGKYPTFQVLEYQRAAIMGSVMAVCGSVISSTHDQLQLKFIPRGTSEKDEAE
jgi:hypothetical protein